MQTWVGAVQATKDKGIQVGSVAAAAMFILVVTRTNDEWASWSEHDNMFVRCVHKLPAWVSLQMHGIVSGRVPQWTHT